VTELPRLDLAEKGLLDLAGEERALTASREALDGQRSSGTSW
jgi:hypothetical protein